MEHRAKEKEKEKEEAESQFGRLPDEVVLHILDKVSDIKWLCRCFMLSNRFSSLTPRVHTLSLNGNLWDSLLKSCSDSHDGGLNFFGRFSQFLANENMFPPLRFLRGASDPSSPSPRNFLDLVSHSKQVRSLNLELFSDFDDHDESFFKWGAKFTAQLDSVTFLYANSLSKMMKSEAAATSENEITQTRLSHPLKLAKRCAIYAILWLMFLSRVLAKFPMLESFTIMDWKNKGVKICRGGEKLVECRNTLDARSMVSSDTPMAWWQRQWRTRVGYVPVLQLPISGYVMKGVTIVNLKMSVNDFEADTAMVDAMVGAFAEEQGPFLEAVVQILEKHKDIIKIDADCCCRGWEAR